MRYYLEPFGPGDNILRRVNLYTATGEEGILLGRNEWTGLTNIAFPNYQYVSRRHILVTRRGDQVFIHPQASQEGVVHLNGQQCNNVEVELKVNDWFSMLGVKNYYNYKLRIDHANQLQTVAPPAPAPPVVVTILDQSVDSIANEYDRPVSIPNSSSGGSNSSSQVNKLTASQPSSLPPPPLRTQSLGSNKSSSQGANESDNSVKIVDLNTTSVEIVAPTTAAFTAGSAAAPTVPAVPAVDPAELERSITKGIVSKMLRQYECSICYETLACAVSLHPCGCCFCYTCIADWATETKKLNTNGEAQCPHCQATFLLSNALSNRTVDSAVREVLQNIPSELSAWETRMQEGNERRRQAEASLGGNKSSSSSSLTSLAAGLTTAAPSAARNLTGAAHSNSSSYSNSGRVRTNGASGLSRNDVVELLDSQPDPYAAFYPPPRTTAVPSHSRGIQSIQSFFGRSAAAPAASTAAPSTSAGAVNAAHSAGLNADSAVRRLPTSNIAGIHHIDGEPSDLTFIDRTNERKRSRLEKAEERENSLRRRLARLDQRFSTDDSSTSNLINNNNNGSGASTAGQAATATFSTTATSSTSTSASTAAATAATAGSSNAVFDLTAVSSPATRRLAAATPARPRSSASVLASAVAAAIPAPTPTPVPAAAPVRAHAAAAAAAAVPANSLFPARNVPGNNQDPFGEEDEFFCVMNVTDLPSDATCTSCTRSFRTLNSALGIFYKRHNNPHKPVSKQEWLLMCNDWRCPLCIVSFNRERRKSMRDGRKLVDYQMLELKENLNHSEKTTWFNILQV